MPIITNRIYCDVGDSDPVIPLGFLTVKNFYSEKVTALSWLVVPEVLSVHDVPSEDVIMVPLDPTTTYIPFP